MNELSNILGYNLYVNPTYIVQIPEYDTSKFTSKSGQHNLIKCDQCNAYTKSTFPIDSTSFPRTLYVCKKCQAKFNLSNNERKADLSVKADKRLKNAVNWLVASAKEKRVFSKVDNKNYRFKINFVTLTLPTLDHCITDKYFTRVMLKKFINALYYHSSLKNYVWRVEAQSNGNIHAHFITDTFIHHKSLRNIWNNILKNEGLINSYTLKHSALNESQYIQLYPPNKTHSLSARVASFRVGQSTNWTNPNTTDIHSVKAIKDIARYIGGYLSKKQDGKRILTCRLWACSESLSQNNKLTMFCEPYASDQYLTDLFTNEIESKVIESKANSMGEKKSLGVIYFIKPSMWGSIIKGKLLELYNKHRWHIRHGIKQIRQVKELIEQKIAQIPIPLPIAPIKFIQSQIQY